MAILKELQEKLKEEQWTRSTIENFGKKESDDLENLLKSIINEKKETEAHQITLDFVKNSPKSITGLYILGLLSYKIDDKENTDSLIHLVEIFKDNKRWSVVETILNKIIENEESIYAYKLLLHIYDNFKKEKEKEKYEILEKLVAIDTENGDLAKRLAEYYEKKDPVLALKYFKSALRRYAKSKQFSLLETIWKKIVSEIPEEIHFFQNIASFIADNNQELSHNLMLSLLDELEGVEKIEEAIFVAKNMLVKEPFNQKIRSRLIDLYREKYKNSTQLEICMKNSGLNDPKSKIENSIKKFEKEILFDQDSYIYHKTWGIGKIQEIKGEDFYLIFDGKINHKMSYIMALKSLMPLTPEHIWVLKKEKKIGNIHSKEEAKKILVAILKSFPDKELSIDNFKDELVPDIINTNEWNKWWNNAKTYLKEESNIGMIKEGRPKYILRDIKLSYEEELINSFHQTKKFDDKVKIYEEFIKESDLIEEFADEFKEMVQYFKDTIQNPRFDFHEQLISFILLKRLFRTNKKYVGEIEYSFSIFNDEDNLIKTLLHNYKADYKKEIINYIEKELPECETVLQEIFWIDRGQLAPHIMEKLSLHLSPEDMKELVEDTIHNKFKMNPYITMWCLERMIEGDYRTYQFSLKDLYIEILYRIDTIGKLMNQKKLNWFTPSISTPEAKNILNTATDILFRELIDQEEGEPTSFIDFVVSHQDEDYIVKIYHLIKNSSGLISTNKGKTGKNELIRQILKKLPHVEEVKSQDDLISHVIIDYLDERIIWSSEDGFNKQRKKIEELNIEKSKNVVEIDKARQKGDLRENAEYQAAREKESTLNNQIKFLQELIDKTKIIDLSQISGEEVTPGTTVQIERNAKKESYTILGFWDTNEEKHILAYNSPLAKAMLGGKKNQDINVEIGGQDVHIKILDIKPYKG
ncbi:MAG TPA: hypothetical protein DHW82_00180 [Spirochaetia bacterium]|nr:MAG: hypothetical protein A2Y41_11055 [Spirochaetes bacterium GWB1_36_13]HCL55418.1 hypothetical protein [Spirochaetia bacterium]